jgi:hypothetical protein
MYAVNVQLFNSLRPTWLVRSTVIALAVAVSPAALPTGSANTPGSRLGPNGETELDLCRPSGPVSTAAPSGRAVESLPAGPRATTPGLASRIRTPVQIGEPWTDGRHTEFTFVHLTDAHVGRSRDTDNFEVVVDELNKLEPAPRFAVLTGDLTDAFLPAQVARFEEIASKIRVPLYVVPGNHDVGFDPKPRNTAFWEAHFPRAKTPYRVDEGPLALIGINTQLFNSRQASKDGTLRAAKEWKQFEELLRSARTDDKRIIILAHIPSVPAFHVDRVGQSWKSGLLDRYRALLAKYDVEAELSGHFHRDEIYYCGDTAKFTREPSFRVMRVTDSGLSYRQHFLGENERKFSYELDLHGLDEARFAKWFTSFGAGDLELFWQIRYAGDTDAPTHLAALDVDFFRGYVQRPFDFQPPKRYARVKNYPRLAPRAPLARPQIHRPKLPGRR